MIFSTHKFSPPWVVDSWCGNCYCTICGEKIYIEDVRKPSKIDGFGDLTIAYKETITGEEFMNILNAPEEN